ncbi:MAG: serine hydrolase [Halobacteriaceae archaeon]
MDGNSLSEEQRSDVEGFVTEWLSDNRIPGAAVAVTDADGILFADGFGARKLDQNEPATEDTLFGIGSSSKSFTALAIMQLAEQGELSVNDPVDEYVGYLSDAPGDPITVKELLTHTSGMPSDGSAGPLVTRPLGIGHIEVPLSSRDDFRRHIEGSVDRRVTDRDTFFYYNSGYTILSHVVEAVADDSFENYVEDNILDPLDMDRSTYSQEDFEDEEDRMTPYVKQEENTTESGFPFDPLIQGPGGLVSSVKEMAAYTRMYINNGSLGDETLLSDEGIEEMKTPESVFGSRIDGTDVEYGYGIMAQDFLDDRLIGHGGSIAVSNFWFGYLEDAELGVAVGCTSTPDAHPQSVGPAVLALLQGEEPNETVPYYKLVEQLERVTGTYGTYRDIGSAEIEREGGTLNFTQQSGLGTFELSLVPDTFEDDVLICKTVMASGMEHPVRFEFDDDDVYCYFERSRYVKE